MIRLFAGFFISVLAFACFGCTSARWSVKENSAVDRGDFTVLSSNEFLSLSSPVTPQNPTLNLRVLSNTTYEYSQKVLAQRTIQDYKPKPWFLVLGLAGAGLAAYAANSKTIAGGQSSAASFSLNIAAALLAGAGIFNMKPVGEPRPTGEERFLRKTGTLIQQDTLPAEGSRARSADIKVWYGNDQLMADEKRSIDNGELAISLGRLLSDLGISGESTGDVGVEVLYGDSAYTYSYALSEILQPYAQVTSRVAELRSSPEKVPGNILAELIQGSQLQILDTVDSQWYKILYGISENYISIEDADIIWRTSDFSEQSEVVAVPVIPFGNIDVENNIPVLAGINSNALGLIVTNETYAQPYSARPHAHRDGQLIQAYLENALGFESQNITRLKDITGGDSLSAILQELEGKANDSTLVQIFLSGYGTITKQGESYSLGYLPVKDSPDSDQQKQVIELSEVFRKIAAIPSGKMIVLSDIEFKLSDEDSNLDRERLNLLQPLRQLSQIITAGKPNSVVIFGSEIEQNSELYVADRGEDKKHHLLPYFFAKALQERNTGMAAIFEYLQRNIPYTARRLHDRSQDPQVYGNTSIELIPEL